MSKDTRGRYLNKETGEASWVLGLFAALGFDERTPENIVKEDGTWIWVCFWEDTAADRIRAENEGWVAAYDLFVLSGADSPDPINEGSWMNWDRYWL